MYFGAEAFFSAFVFIKVSSLQPQHSLNCPDAINMTHVVQNNHQYICLPTTNDLYRPLGDKISGPS